MHAVHEAMQLGMRPKPCQPGLTHPPGCKTTVFYESTTDIQERKLLCTLSPPQDLQLLYISVHCHLTLQQIANVDMDPLYMMLPGLSKKVKEV